MNAAQRIALDQATRQPGTLVLLIDADNIGQGLKQWSAQTAATSGKAYAVVPRDGLIVGDFDTEDGISNALEAARLIEDAKIGRPTVWASGRPGHAHLWLNATGEARDIVIGILKTMKATPRQGNGGRTRPPGSPHRNGTPSELVYPIDIEDATERLSPAYGRLSKKARKALEDGWERGHRSKGLLILAREYQRAGIDLEAFTADVLNHPDGAGAKMYETSRGRQRTGPRRDAARYLKGAWTTAANYEPAEDRLGIIKQIHRLALVAEWPPRRRQLALTLLGLATIAEKASDVEIDVSVRGLAEVCGITYPTAWRHLRQLRELGWIIRTKKHDGTDAACYRLTVPDAYQDETHSGHPIGLGVVPPGVFHERTLEAFRRCPGLRVVWELLLRLKDADPHQLTVPYFSQRFRMRPHAVRSHLRRLEAWGLIVRHGQTFEVALDAFDRLEVIAEQRGTLGSIEAQKALHQRQREGYLDHLQQWSAKYRHPIDIDAQDFRTLIRRAANTLGPRPPGRVEQREAGRMTA